MLLPQKYIVSQFLLAAGANSFFANNVSRSSRLVTIWYQLHRVQFEAAKIGSLHHAERRKTSIAGEILDVSSVYQKITTFFLIIFCRLILKS